MVTMGHCRVLHGSLHGQRHSALSSLHTVCVSTAREACKKLLHSTAHPAAPPCRFSPGCQPVRMGAQSNLGKHWYLRSVGFHG